MACVHLQQLYRLCQTEELTLSSSDLIHIFCHQCGKQDVCPSNLMDDEDEDPSLTKRHADDTQA